MTLNNGEAEDPEEPKDNETSENVPKEKIPPTEDEEPESDSDDDSVK